MKRHSLMPLSELELPPTRCGFRLALARTQGHAASPRFDMSAERLWRLWLTVAARQPRTKLLAQDVTNRRALHVQRSRVFRFPDLVRAEVIDLGSERSSIALDSRVRFGYYDFGVNRQRVIEWMRLLDSAVRQASF